MRSANSRPITETEAEHLAFVKSVGCVFCPWRGPTEAHHPKGCQGLHYCTISACKECHDLRVWTFCGMTEMQALDETNRRVDCLRKGEPFAFPAMAKKGRQKSTRTPTKIIPRSV